jgi:hypothetical protein
LLCLGKKDEKGRDRNGEDDGTCFSIAWYHGETLTWLCIDLVNQFWRQLWENGDKIIAFVFSIVANVTKKVNIAIGSCAWISGGMFGSVSFESNPRQPK